VSVVGRGPFEMAVPHALDDSRRIVIDTLTALLDEPFVVKD